MAAPTPHTLPQLSPALPILRGQPGLRGACEHKLAAVPAQGAAASPQCAPCSDMRLKVALAKGWSPGDSERRLLLCPASRAGSGSCRKRDASPVLRWQESGDPQPAAPSFSSTTEPFPASGNKTPAEGAQGSCIPVLRVRVCPFARNLFFLHSPGVWTPTAAPRCSGHRMGTPGGSWCQGLALLRWLQS